MKFVLPGGSGQVGAVLARALGGEGHDVVVLNRNGTSPAPARAATWDGRTLGPWAEEVDGADVVINLAHRLDVPDDECTGILGSGEPGAPDG